MLGTKSCSFQDDEMFNQATNLVPSKRTRVNSSILNILHVHQTLGDNIHVYDKLFRIASSHDLLTPNLWLQSQNPGLSLVVFPKLEIHQLHKHSQENTEKSFKIICR